MSQKLRNENPHEHAALRTQFDNLQERMRIGMINMERSMAEYNRSQERMRMRMIDTNRKIAQINARLQTTLSQGASA